jgi:hypothetical protein
MQEFFGSTESRSVKPTFHTEGFKELFADADDIVECLFSEISNIRKMEAEISIAIGQPMDEAPLSLTETAQALSYALLTVANGDPNHLFTGRDDTGDFIINDKVIDNYSKIQIAWRIYKHYSDSVGPVCDKILDMLQEAFAFLNERLELTEE